ncbi:MAG: low molecular weight protein-tyrosine-phosphatase [Chitinophagaceae bacterium]
MLTIFARMKVLMVCLGNICRSPLAEGILKEKVRQAGLNWVVESAGTNRYHTGEAPHPLSQKVALHNGIDISAQRARSFIPEDIKQYDRIYALAGDVLEDIRKIAGANFDSNKVELLLNEQFPTENREVPDPYYGAEDGYHKVFAMIDEVCTTILEKYSNSVTR